MTDEIKILLEKLANTEKELAETEEGIKIRSTQIPADQEGVDWAIKRAVELRERKIKLKEQLAKEQANKKGS